MTSEALGPALIGSEVLTAQAEPLLAASATGGTTLADDEPSSPAALDGLAAAQGRSCLSTKNGEVVCMGPAG